MKRKYLDSMFGTAEEINGDHRCETYLYRWVVLSTRFFKVYLHHFVGNDWSRDFHDHPKRFWSIGLYGWYIEQAQVDGGPLWSQKTYRAPWVRTFPAEHRHRLIVPSKNCWTLVIVGRLVREWGFWHGGQFIHWKEYVYGKASEIADRMRDC